MIINIVVACKMIMIMIMTMVMVIIIVIRIIDMTRLFNLTLSSLLLFSPHRHIFVEAAFGFFIIDTWLCLCWHVHFRSQSSEG